MNKIRIGVLGCASIAKRLFIPAIICMKDKYKLVGVASRTMEKANNFATIFQTTPIIGYENMLDRTDIDAVYIPLPTGLHKEWVKKALESGKHVIAEKSFVSDYNSTQELVDLAKSKGLLIMENFMYRYHLQHQLVWQKILNNDLGQIRLFRSQFGFPPLEKSNFRYNLALGGGSLLDAGAYTVNASLWFLGKEQEVATSTLYIDKKTQVDIYGNATLINNKGIVSQLSFGFDNSYQCNYEFWGSKGTLVLPKAFTPKPNEITHVIIEQQGKTDTFNITPDNHFINLLNNFYEKIESNLYNTAYEEIISQSKMLSEICVKSIKIQI